VHRQDVLHLNKRDVLLERLRLNPLLLMLEMFCAAVPCHRYRSFCVPRGFWRSSAALRALYCCHRALFWMRSI
jgi:hypothetical protein